MKVLNGIQALGTQTFNAVADSGDTVYFTLYFKPSIQMWFMDLECGDFILYGNRICNSPNLLQQYSKILSFGLNVSVSDGGEPFMINDFSESRVELGLLDEDEVVQIIESYQEAKE